ncbi:unnamed protein product [Lymnaea stagnalis]|uniref:LITAF domain-containing protein n=1 Tax=Lymnaea stagnalis TaxID=6523 RepID=A0AAV2H1T7_LYMST
MELPGARGASSRVVSVQKVGEPQNLTSTQSIGALPQPSQQLSPMQLAAQPTQPGALALSQLSPGVQKPPVATASKGSQTEPRKKPLRAYLCPFCKISMELGLEY